MFSEDEIREFDKMFEEIGIAEDEASQKKILVLDFFYTFGTIVYNNIII